MRKKKSQINGMKCPVCGTEFVQLTEKRRPRKMADYNFSVPQMFRSEAVAEPWRQQTAPSMRAPELAPDHRRTLEHYRMPAFMADVMQPLAWALVSGILAGAITITFKGPVFKIGLITTAVLWLAQELPSLVPTQKDARHLMTKDETRGPPAERRTEPPQGNYTAQGTISDGAGKTIYTKFNIGDPIAWHNFCRAVVDGANFSGNVAVNNGVTRPEFNRIIELWDRPDPQRALVDPKTVGERKTPQLTRMGKRMVKLFAEAPPTPNL